MTAALIRLEGVGKDYPKLQTGAGRLRLIADLLVGRGIREKFCAVDNVTFSLRPGQSLGIVGENGAGKSTLLKIVAGVIAPTRGKVEVSGRVSALLELGSGFHPDYSGLANIDLAAALMGLSAREIAAKRAEIVAFADIGEHIREPVKHYSSGMVVRLGFAVATALRPEILITDEVLAVGDESFQKKCVAWIEGYLAAGGTLLLCSHSMYHIQKLCRHALWLKEGQVAAYGNAFDVSQAYLSYHEEKTAKQHQAMPVEAAVADGLYAIRSLALRGAEGEDVATRETGESLHVTGAVYSPDGRPPNVLVGVVRADGTPVYGVSTEMEEVRLPAGEDGLFRFDVEFGALPLLPGKYVVRAHAMDPEGLRLFDTVELPLRMHGGSREMGLVRIPHRWHE